MINFYKKFTVLIFFIIPVFFSFGKETINFKTKIYPDQDTIRTSTKTIDSVSTTTDIDLAYLKTKDNIIYPPIKRDFKRLGYNVGIFAGFSVLIFSALWVLPDNVSNWNKPLIREKGIAYKWKIDIKRGPVWDEDLFFINYVLHPLAGGMYYITARSAGFTPVESFAFSFIASTFFWEYGIEAFAEIPSIQDIIITPVLGAVVGEGFFYAKRAILKNNSKILNSGFLGKFSILLLDPFNTILDGFGYKSKVSTSAQFVPMSFNGRSSGFGIQINTRF